jgi:hypothetical protein
MTIHQIRSRHLDGQVTFCGKSVRDQSAYVLAHPDRYCLRCLYSRRESWGDENIRLAGLPLVARVRIRVEGEFDVYDRYELQIQKEDSK